MHPLQLHPALCALAAQLMIVALGCAVEKPTPSATDNSSTTPPPNGAVVLLEDFSARRVFPSNNWWNLDAETSVAAGQTNSALSSESSVQSPENEKRRASCIVLL